MELQGDEMIEMTDDAEIAAAEITDPEVAEPTSEVVAAADEAAAAEGASEAAGGDESVDATGRLAGIVESLLFAAGDPLTVKRIAEALGGPRSRPSNKEINAALRRLREDYAPGRRGIQLVEVAGGYQFRTARENAEFVRALLRERPSRLGRATLETLAIIAYKQPVTRAEIEAVRGVDVDAALNTLQSRRLIKIAGRKETVGRPLLFVTTSEFLEVFGLESLSNLPPLAELDPNLDEANLTPQAEADEGGITADSASDAANQAAAPEVLEAHAEQEEGEPSAAASHDEGDDGEDGGPARASAEDPGASRDSLAARSRNAD